MAGTEEEPDESRPTILPVSNRSARWGPFTLRWQSGAFCRTVRSRPEIVVMTGMPSVLSNWLICLWARLTHRPVLMWVCGWEIHSPNTFSYSLKAMILRIYFSLSTRLLTYSTTAMSYLADIGVSPKKMAVCYNGLDIDGMEREEQAIRRHAASLRMEQADPGVLFLFVGQMTPPKNVSLLINAFAEIARHAPDRVHLWLVGDGPERPALEALAETHAPKQIKFWGERIEDADQMFAAADFFVLPGIGGLALNQAMQFGVPCICSEADGTERDLVVHGETGFRFETGSATSLAEAMNLARLSYDTDAYAGMQHRAKQLIVSRSNCNEMVRTFGDALAALALEKH